MSANSAETQLQSICDAAVRKAKGNTEKAYEFFNYSVTEKNDAALERELCKAYRSSALRAWIAESYQRLRAKGDVPRISAHRIATTDYERPKERKPTWASQHVEGIGRRIEEERIAYEKRLLDAFLVNGEPIGDCTAEVVLGQAERREKDARFMRLMAQGVPPQGKIRDYVTADEAEARWKAAETSEKTNIQSMLSGMDWITKISKPIKDEAEFDQARARAWELMDAKPHTWEGIELDSLARRIAAWEDEHS